MFSCPAAGFHLFLKFGMFVGYVHIFLGWFESYFLHAFPVFGQTDTICIVKVKSSKCKVPLNQCFINFMPLKMTPKSFLSTLPPTEVWS